MRYILVKNFNKNEELFGYPNCQTVKNIPNKFFEILYFTNSYASLLK
jgi:hypothetical protein